MFSRSTIGIFIIVLFIGGFIAIRGVQEYKSQIQQKKIGIIQAIEHPALDKTRDGVIAAIEKLGDGKFKILHESGQGDIALSQQIIQKFIQQKVVAIVTIGTTVTQIAANTTKDIPVIFASVTDPIGSGVVKDLESPKGNVTGISNFKPDITEVQLKFFKELLPSLQTLGIIYNPSEANSVRLLQDVKEKALDFDIKIREAPAQDTNEAALIAKAFINKCDAIFVNNDNTALAALKGIVDVAMKQKKPVFCSDTDTIPLGVLGAVGPNQFKIGYQAGKQVIDVLLHDKKISEIPVEYTTEDEFMVNTEAAKKLDITIPERSDIIKVVTAE